MSGTFDQHFAGRIEWIPFSNQSGQTIPPFSIIQSGGWLTPEANGGLQCAIGPTIMGYQPGAPGIPNSYLPTGTINPDSCYITGAGATPAGSLGACARPTSSTPLLLALSAQTDPGDVPYRMCGPAPPLPGQGGTWTGTRDYPGFAMLGSPYQGRALVVPTHGPYVGGVPDPQDGIPRAAINAQGSGALTIYVVRPSGDNASLFALGNEVPTKATLNVYNGFTTIDTGERVLFDFTGQGWEVLTNGGQTIIRGVLQAVLNQGGSAPCLTTGNIIQPVHEVLGLNGGSIAQGKNIAAFWNPDENQWEVIAPSASAVTLIRGTLQGALASGGSCQFNPVAGTPGNIGTPTAYEVLGLGSQTVPAGKSAWVTFNQVTNRYEIVNIGC